MIHIPVKATQISTAERSAWLIHPPQEGIIQVPPFDAYLYNENVEGKEVSIRLQTLEILTPKGRPEEVLVLATAFIEKIEELLNVDPLEIDPNSLFSFPEEMKKSVNPENRLYIIQGIRMSLIEITADRYNWLLENAELRA